MAMSTPSSHKISQETFDETLLENQELFELSHDEAIAETISQFEQQGITNLSTYIITSHPESTKGIQDRKTRNKFQSHLNVLDSLINVDGTVDVEKAMQKSGSDGGSGEEEESVILIALNGVLEFCNGTYQDECEEGQIDAENGENDNGSGGGDNGTNDNDEDVISKRPDDAAGSTKYEKSMPFLTLFHASDGLFTLMSLLSIVPITSSSSPTTTSDNVTSTRTTTEEQAQILRKVAHVTTKLLTPRRACERDIKSNIRDQFVVMERLIRLISHFLQLYRNNQDGDNDSDSDSVTSTTHGETLSSLINLATAACRSSERNKVSFVRTLKIARRGEQQQDNDQGGLGKCNSTIALIVQALHSVVGRYQKQNQNQNQSQESQQEIKLMTEMCKLITVLCRFDDFRPDGSSDGGGLGVDSSMGMNVSSSHDHVLEFNRSGVVPILHDVSCIALDTKRHHARDAVATAEENVVALAGAALSATRVLAVNDEIVQAMVAVGTLKVVKLALEMGVKEVLLDCDDDNKNDDQESNNMKQKQEQIKLQRQHLTSGAIGLVRNLCGNDEIKTSLCLGQKLDAATSTLPTILHGMRLYRTNATIQEHGCGTLAAMALRKPANALRIVQDDGPKEIMNAMRQFPNNVLVQRQGALAVRNIVSRLVANTSSVKTATTDGSGSVDNAVVVNNNTVSTGATDCINVKDVFLDLGAEIILRQITGRHQGSVDEAYAALRDLGCQISMVKYDAETNTTKRRTEMFGEVKSNFRPVYEQSNGSVATMQERIASHAAKNGM